VCNSSAAITSEHRFSNQQRTSSATSSTQISDTVISTPVSTIKKATSQKVEATSETTIKTTTTTTSSYSSALSSAFSSPSSVASTGSLSSNDAKKDSSGPSSAQGSPGSAPPNDYTKINALVEQALKWIEMRHADINSIEYKTDIAVNELELAKIRHLTNEIKKYHTNLEQIELLKLQLIESAELNSKLDDLFSSFNGLCKSLSTSQQFLETLMEFNKLIQDELKYVNDMEDIEYNRDWTQPRRLKSSDLIQHKSNVELTLNHKSKKIMYIVSFVERMIESQHPASADLVVYLTTLKTEIGRLHQLMTILGEHVVKLQSLEAFCKEYDEVAVYLDVTNQKFQHFLSILSRSSKSESGDGNMSEQYAEIVSQFDIFKHNFQNLSQTREHIDDLYAFVEKLPAYKMRKTSLKPPHDKCEILADFSNTTVSFYSLFFVVANNL
jgi:hypothetical protein